MSKFRTINSKRKTSFVSLNRSTLPLFIALLLVLINLVKLSNLLVPVIYFIFVPPVYLGSQLGGSIKNSVETISEIKDLRHYNNKLRLENSELRGENLFVEELIKENLAIQKELQLGNKDEKKLEVEVIKYDSAGYITINKGQSDGIKEGNLVVIGNTYIGRVAQVLPESAKVILPINTSNILEVDIRADKNYKEVDLLEIEKLYTLPGGFNVKGAAKGASSGISIENIAKSSKVIDGDIVIVNDEKVGRYLLLGTITNIVDDPTKPEKQAEVKPIVNYEELSFLFVYLND